MKFPFKTLEQQLNESGFKPIARISSDVDNELQIFTEDMMERVGKAINHFIKYRRTRNCREIYLQVKRPEHSFGECNCERCLGKYEVRIYIGN